MQFAKVMQVGKNSPCNFGPSVPYYLLALTQSVYMWHMQHGRGLSDSVSVFVLRAEVCSCDESS